MEIRKIDKKKPKIALLVDAWFPHLGGGQVHVAELARFLALDHGFEVDILTRRIAGRRSSYEKDVCDVPGVTIKQFGIKSEFSNPFMRLWYMIAVFFYLLFKGKNYRLAHSHCASACVPMKFASWITRVPTMVTVHGSMIFSKGFSVKKMLEKVIYLETKYSKEITVSENFLKAKNVNQHIPVIANGVDVERFDAIQAEKRSESFDVLFVGRLDYVKGLDVLISAMKKVVESTEFIKSKKDFQLHIVGTGSEKNALEKQIEKLGLQGLVKFHGKVTGDPLVAIYKSADLFVLPSRTEGFPLSLLEACAAKLPVLATNVGDNSKLVIEKENGYLVAPEDQEELSYYLELFVLNPGLRQMGEKSYDLVLQEYTWHRVSEKMVHIYESVMSMEEPESKKHSSRVVSFFLDKRMPWNVPNLLLQAKLFDKPYEGRKPLKFALTVDVEQSYGSLDLPHEDDHVGAFLDRFTDMAKSLEVPATFFFQADLLTNYIDEIFSLQESEHEIGIHGLHHELWGKRQWFLKDAWLSVPKRKKALRIIRETIDSLNLKDVRAFRAPNLVVDKDSLRLIREAEFEIDSSSPTMLGAKPLPSLKNGLCRMPVSRDPMPHLQWRYGLPFGSYKVMNLANFISMSDEELLAAVSRLREYQRAAGVDPHLVFLCHSWEFQSRDHMDMASGENFSILARKIAILKEHMELQFRTLTDLCTDLYANS
ncbi:glycosyltransferase [Patescibacteria group bacterium]|nr:glycosyltransferase [Patescibacteria group bacterium]